MLVSGIYKITNIINGKIYIGKTTKTIEERFKEHVKTAKLGKGYNLHKAIRKHGQENFKIEVIFVNSSNEILNKMEMFFIKKFQSHNPLKGYNMTLGGEGGNMTEETKQKLRGENNSNFGGKSVSQYQIEIGRIRAREQFKNPEDRIKHGLKMKGRVPWNKGKKLNKQILLN